MKPKKTTISNGTWAVVAMCLIGCIAGTIAVVHWAGVKQHASAKYLADRPKSKVSAPTWSREKASQELERVRKTYVDLRHEKRGNLQTIIKATRQLVKRYPQFAAGYFFLGQTLVDAAHYQQARQQLLKGLAIDHEKPDIYLLISNLSLMLNQVDQAETFIKQALSLTPNSGRYRLYLAEIQVLKKNYPQAIKILLEALQLDSGLHGAYAALSDIYARQGKTGLAITEIQKAITQLNNEKLPRFAIYMRKKSMLLRRDNRPDQALQTLQILNIKERTKPKVLNEMATCWAMLGKPRKAAAMYEQMQIVTPDDWRLVAGAAEWYLKAGQLAKAKSHIVSLKQMDASLPIIKKLQNQLTAQIAKRTTSKTASQAVAKP